MTVLEISEVSKSYLLHRGRQLAARSVGRRVRTKTEPFWALRDVSFRVEAGEKLAIVGGNGAGKSTLLGIVAGVISPTKGEVRRQGRIGALLELGTGFHPDLTGRENIHLNASLLGFNRVQIEQEFETIVEFAGLSAFIDEPVRTYSSGMVGRLGFSVAVHVDPDILIMDEVLAVGDQGFQEICLAKVQELAGRGKTILFVSHSMTAVLSMCPRAIWLERGGVRMEGRCEKVVDAYKDSIALRPAAEIVKSR
jgi:ABC-type polysaccharide/polyol phosphate transport system ATPase subunit